MSGYSNSTYSIGGADDLALVGKVVPPDPEAMGKIRNIVKTAHKWGGDGTKPKFTKIKRVLIAKHPEVIAKAFGGDPNKAAGWIKANWYRFRGRPVPGTRGKGVQASLSLDGYVEAPREFFEDAAELFLSSDAAEGDGGLVYATALRTGEWRVNPIPGAKGPLRVDKAFMDEVLQAWKDGAWEHVQVPTYHTDSDPLANTGFVRDVQVVPDAARPGEYLLRTGIEFTEPDVKQRVLRGSIAGLSVNVKFNVQHQESGKTYPKVLTHVCLTNIPFINGLDAFKQRLAADRGAEPDDVVGSYVHEDDADLPDMAVFTEVGELPHELPLDEDDIEDAEAEDLVDAEGDPEDALDDEALAAAKTSTKTVKLANLKSGDHFRTNSGHVFKHVGAHPSDPNKVLARNLKSTALRAFPKKMVVRRVVGIDPMAMLSFTKAPAGVKVVDPDNKPGSGDEYAVDANGKRLKGKCVDPDGKPNSGDEYILVDPDGKPNNGDEYKLACAFPEWDVEELALRQIDVAKRKQLAKEGKALSDGSFPIETVQDLENAIQSLGRAKDRAAAVALIKKRARELNREDLVKNLSAQRIRVISRRGGAGMAGEEETEVTLTREELDAQMAAATEAALTRFREEQAEREAERERELAATRAQLHVMGVKERVDALTAKGHAPAVVAKAKELMLADERQAEALSLTRSNEDGSTEEVKLSATQIVEEILDAIPATALSATNVELGRKVEINDDNDPVKRGDALYEELYGKDKKPAVQLAD